MRTTIVMGSAVAAAAVLALAGCGKSTAGQNAAKIGNTSASATATSVSSDSPESSTAPSPPPATTKPRPTTPKPTTSAPTSAAASSSPPPAAAAGARCHTSDLWAVMQPLGAAAGNLYGKILLTNHSGATCTVYGYGGIGLYSSSGGSVPTHQVRDTSVAPVTITLKPGDHAYSQLHWADVPGPGESSTRTCEPQASVIQVIPPDETRALDAHWPGSPACEHGRIQQTAYRAGTGPASGG